MTLSAFASAVGLILHQWKHWLLNLLLVVVSGIFLIPVLRSYPSVVHDFANNQPAWLRCLFIFLLCVLLAYFMFELFSPRISHLYYIKRYPPAWLACVFGVLIIAVVDLCAGLSPTHYVASAREWIAYGLGSVLLVCLCRWVFGSTTNVSIATKGILPPRKIPLEGDWTSMEEWLKSDTPASYDFLENYAVAQRIKTLLERDTRSIGIVGPFGAGKTSIINWLSQLVSNDNDREKTRLVISNHSCWGFETSSSSIHSMLADAIEIIHKQIDTFYVRSLPESYRQTFSSGGEWLDRLSKLMLRKQDPVDQFGRLSALLDVANVRLVFVVEDLDRNDSRTFDGQEILAFLQQLKEFPRLSFVLTAGLSPSRDIDFAKLCDHIEYLKLIEPRVAANLARFVYDRCHDTKVFPQVFLPNPEREHVWNEWSEFLLHDWEEMSFQQAVAILLNTPRFLRLTLGRTYLAWHVLAGEVDWNDLLAINVLRFSAPECFSFLVRMWHRLHSPPSDSTYGRENLPQIRRGVGDDWAETIRNVDWNSKAAKRIMKFVLPASESWLVENSLGIAVDTPQSIQNERYWRRVANEAIDPDDARDQMVIRDLHNWLDKPSCDSELVLQLCKSKPYCIAWDDLVGRLLNNPDQILLLCQHVLSRICHDHGPAASSESQGFMEVLRFASRRVGLRVENRKWLEERMDEAAGVSLELLNSLWRYYGIPSNYCLLLLEDCESVRYYEIGLLRQRLINAEALEILLDSKFPYVIYQLIFDPGNRTATPHVPLSTWAWIGPVLLESMRRRNTLVGIAVASLLTARTSGTTSEARVLDKEILRAIFLGSEIEVLQLLSQLSSGIVEPDHRRIVDSIVESGNMALANNTLLVVPAMDQPDEATGDDLLDRDAAASGDPAGLTDTATSQSEAESDAGQGQSGDTVV